MGQEFYVEAESISFSETLNFEAILDGLEGGQFREDGDISFTHSQTAAGWRWRGFDLAATFRYDYVADYSSDAVALLIGGDNGFEIEDGDFDVDVRLNRAAGVGARLGYVRSFFDDRLTLGAYGSALATSALQEGTLEGLVNVSGGGSDFAGELELDYVFSNDIVFDSEVTAPNGFGLTFDIVAALAITDRLSAEIEINDIWSRIWWQDAPRTIASASTDNVTSNPDGSINVTALLSGQSSIEDTTTRYFTRTQAELSYRLNEKWTLSQDVFNLRSAVLSTSQIEYGVNEHLSVGFEVEWVTRAVGFGVNWRGFEAGITTDNFDLLDARYLRANIGYAVRF